MSYDMMTKVEDGWIGQLQLNTYIDTNNIPVSHFRQNGQDAEHNSITVFARLPRTGRDRDQDTWLIPTQIMCYTHSADDEDIELLRKLIDAVFAVAIENDLGDFSTSGNINFLGIGFDEDHDEEYDDKKQLVIINLVTTVTDVNQ